MEELEVLVPELKEVVLPFKAVHAAIDGIILKEDLAVFFSCFIQGRDHRRSLLFFLLL